MTTQQTVRLSEQGPMTTNDIVRNFITQNFFVADSHLLTDDALLLEHGVVDSTGVLEVIHFVETNFAIKVEDDEIDPDNLGSIARIAAFLERKGGVFQVATAGGNLAVQ